MKKGTTNSRFRPGDIIVSIDKAVPMSKCQVFEDHYVPLEYRTHLPDSVGVGNKNWSGNAYHGWGDYWVLDEVSMAKRIIESYEL